MAHEFPTTRFEKVATIAARVEQLSNGAVPHPSVGACPWMDFQDIAHREYEAGLLNFASRMTFPAAADGTVKRHDKPTGPPEKIKSDITL